MMQSETRWLKLFCDAFRGIEDLEVLIKTAQVVATPGVDCTPC